MMKEEVPGLTFKEQQQEERNNEEQNQEEDEEEPVDEFNEIIYKGETLVSKVDGLTIFDAVKIAT